MILVPGKDPLPSTGENTNITVLAVDGQSPVIIPGEGFIQLAHYARQGTDLLLTGPDGRQVVVQNYFENDTPPPLVSDGGATISGDTAEILAGPEAPAQYAQAGTPAGGVVIGKVADIAGDVRATKTDGTVVTLQKDAIVHQGDVIETAAGAKLGIIFIDKTTFAIGENARMVLNEMIFDPSGGKLSSVVSLLHGAFLFVTGEIGKLVPESVVVNTPVGTIGVRGTETSALVDQVLETLQVASERGPNEGTVVLTVNNAQYLLPPGTLATNITPQTIQVTIQQGSLIPTIPFQGQGLPDVQENTINSAPPANTGGDGQDQNESQEATNQSDIEAAAAAAALIAPAAGSGAGAPEDEPDGQGIGTDSALGVNYAALLNAQVGGTSITLSQLLDAIARQYDVARADLFRNLIEQAQLEDGDDDNLGFTDPATPDLPDSTPDIVNGTASWNFGDGDQQIVGGQGTDDLLAVTGSTNFSNNWSVNANPLDPSRVEMTLNNPGLPNQPEVTLDVDGIETLQINAGDAGDTVQFGPLATTDVTNNTLIVEGGAGADVIDGHATDRTLEVRGHGGDDVLTGGNQNDRLDGGLGNDTLIGGDGFDQIDGGEGTDTVSYDAASGGVTVDMLAQASSASATLVTDWAYTLDGGFVDFEPSSNILAPTDSENDNLGLPTTISWGDTDIPPSSFQLDPANNGNIAGNIGTSTDGDPLTFASGNTFIHNNNPISDPPFLSFVTLRDQLTLTPVAAEDENGVPVEVAGLLDLEIAPLDLDLLFIETPNVGTNIDDIVVIDPPDDTTVSLVNGEVLLSQSFAFEGHLYNSHFKLSGLEFIDDSVGAGTCESAGGSAGCVGLVSPEDGSNSFSMLFAIEAVETLSSIDSLSNTENLIGSAFDDSLKGSHTSNEILAGAGDDVIDGRGGDDVLRGEDGDDRLIGGGGNDTIDGGSGIDTSDYSDRSDAMTVNLETGVATGSGSDTDTLISVENVLAGAGADTIIGNASDNLLAGGAGDDRLLGGQGSDTLQGDSGIDTLVYTAPSDGAFVALNSDGNADKMGDVLIGFSSGEDIIEVAQTAFGFSSANVTDGGNFAVIAGSYEGVLTPGLASEHDLGNGSLVYSVADRTLYHDANGNSDGYTVVATVQSGDDIAAGDISVV